MPNNPVFHHSNTSHLSLVDVTPTPVFTRFEGLDDRMAARKKMFSGVAIRRRFAAADVTASQTQAQMQPRRTDFQTILATVGARTDRPDPSHMGVSHHIVSLAFASLRSLAGQEMRNERSLRSSKRNLDRDIKFTIVFLHVVGAVLGAKLLDDLVQLGAIGDRSRPLL